MRDFIKKLFSDKSEETPRKSKGKLLILLAVFALAFLILAGRLMWLQLFKGKEYAEKAYKQQQAGRTLDPVRGKIYDSNGNILATSLTASKVSVNSNYINTLAENGKINLYETRGKIATKLSETLGVSYNDVMTALEKKSSYAVVATKIDTEKGKEIAKWTKDNIPGAIYVDNTFIRYYPNGNLGSHVLGFTGTDDQGLVCGVEVALNDYLTGTPGRVIADIDTSGNELPYDQVRRIDAVNGYNAILTIDINIQSIAERKLREAVVSYGVEEGACCIIMDPKTCDVLAMASYPVFDPNDPYGYPVDANLAIPIEEWQGNSEVGVEILNATVWRNKALTDTYEPGSTFKALVTTMLLDEATVTKETKVTDDALSLAGWTIRCWADNDDTEEDESHGEETFEEAVINSCNPVFAKMALKLGLERFYRYVEAFGFRNKTGIMLSGEASSIIHPQPTTIDLAVAAFGQRFQVSAIQMATAYCALANGGTLCTPRIVKYLTDENGNVVKSFETEVLRRVVSEDTCKETLGILQKVVDEGTGSNAYIPGYRIAGKTGTSETTDTAETGRYVVSFAGIAPAEDPEIVVLVVLDHPTVGSIGGGAIAAPVAGEIIEEVLTYKGIEKKYTQDDFKRLTMDYYVPDYTQQTVQEVLAKMGSTFKGKVIGDDTSLTATVIAQYPPAQTPVTRGSVIFLYTSENAEHAKVIVPDLTGLTIDESFNLLNSMDLNMTGHRIGKVVWQDIPAGTEVEVGTAVNLAIRNTDMETSENAGAEENGEGT